MAEPARRHSNRISSGIFLIVLGVLFLLDSLDVMNFSQVFVHWWPLILVGLGLMTLRGEDKSGGVLLIVIGLILLGLSLDFINWHQITDYWPVVLIIIGLMTILEGRRHGDNKDQQTPE